MVIHIESIGCHGCGEEEEGEFELSGFIDHEGVVVRPLRLPGCFDVDGLVRQCCGDGAHVVHVVVRGVVSAAGGLVDEPDFDGVVHDPLFMVRQSNLYGGGLIDGEVVGIGFCFTGRSKEVQFGEGLPCFWCHDDVDERGDHKDDGDGKDDGEYLVEFVAVSG